MLNPHFGYALRADKTARLLRCDGFELQFQRRTRRHTIAASTTTHFALDQSRWPRCQFFVGWPERKLPQIHLMYVSFVVFACRFSGIINNVHNASLDHELRSLHHIIRTTRPFGLNQST